MITNIHDIETSASARHKPAIRGLHCSGCYCPVTYLLQLVELMLSSNWHVTLRLIPFSRYSQSNGQKIGPKFRIWRIPGSTAPNGQPPVWCWTFLVRRRHWETEHLPSPDRVSGTVFLLPSVIRHCRRQSSESCWKLICLFKGRGAGDLWTGALEMY